MFADKLYIPTGFELGDGGVYVSQQPNLMFLRDTNGDGRADERRTILHGFGTEDSHHSIHAYHVGDRTARSISRKARSCTRRSRRRTARVRLENAGVFRYEPRTEKLSVFVSYPFANPWGHVVDRWGQNFISDASNGYNYYGTAFSGHVDYPVKQPIDAGMDADARAARPAGIEFVRSRHFPDAAQGNFLFNNTIGFQGIKQYRVQRGGVGLRGDRNRARCCSRPIPTSGRWACSSAPTARCTSSTGSIPLDRPHAVLDSRSAARQAARAGVADHGEGSAAQHAAPHPRRSRSRRSSSC